MAALAFAAPGYSQTSNQTGVTISPSLQDIVIEPQDEQVLTQLKITNHTDQTQRFQLSVVDFGALDETGGVAIEGLNATSLRERYGLAEWATLSEELVEVDPQQSTTVDMVIQNRQSLRPGGHYGAILVESPSGTGSGITAEVRVDLFATALLFVSKQGGETTALALEEPDIGWQWWQLPSSIALRFENTGNVHTVPRGLVEVTGPFDTYVGKGIINTGSSIVLPETFRQLPSELNYFGAGWLPGTYEAAVQYRPDTSQEFTTITVSFFYLGWPTIAAGAVLLVLLMVWLKRRYPTALVFSRRRMRAGWYRLASKLKRRS